MEARVGALDLGDRERLDLAAAVGLAVEQLLVERDENAVARDVNVGLDTATFRSSPITDPVSSR